MSSDTAEKPTPPVPPTDIERIRDHDTGTRILDRTPQRTPCPCCERETVLEERQTGYRILAFWDPETFDAETFRLSTSWRDVEVRQCCDHCGWVVEVA